MLLLDDTNMTSIFDVLNFSLFPRWRPIDVRLCLKHVEYGLKVILLRLGIESLMMRIWAQKQAQLLLNSHLLLLLSRL